MTTTSQQVEQAEAQAAEAEAQAARARLAHSSAVAAADTERDRLALEFARQRVGAYDPKATQQAERTAHRAFAQALADNELVSAWVHWQTARLWAIRAAALHNHDRHAAGLPALEVPSMPFDSPDYAESLKGAAAAEVYARLEAREAEWQAEADVAVHGPVPQSREDQTERGRKDDERRRREAATINPPGFLTPAEGLTERARADLGIPSGAPDRTS